MKITIEFDTENAAFEDNPTQEVNGLLKQASAIVADILTDNRCRYTVKLRDSNGNTVGTVVGEMV